MRSNIQFLIYFISFLLTACNFDKDSIDVSESQLTNSKTRLVDSQVIFPRQQQLDRFAQNLQINYQVLDNRPADDCAKSSGDGKCFLAQLSLQLTQPVKLANWKIYFSFMSPIQQDFSEQFDIVHYNGDLHYLIPTEKFTGWETDRIEIIQFKAAFWQIAEFDVPPNFYVVADGLEPKIIDSTRSIIDAETGQETLPFVTPLTNKTNQLLRTQNDLTERATAEKLFSVNRKLGSPIIDVSRRIIPQPLQMKSTFNAEPLELKKGIYIRSNEFSIQPFNPALQRIQLLGIKINDTSGVPIDIIKSQQSLGIEGYTLNISAEQISIAAQSNTGIFYGLQSLAALLVPNETTIPQVEIIDKPRFEFRGFHLDVARNFRNKAFVIKLLDQMAAYKLNKLHLHLADDEGWRMEIPGLAELTQVGGTRCHDLSETQCLLPQLGNGPVAQSSEPQFYSVSDYQQILQAAKARSIEVIPSFDMPGHSRAAVKSMQARYRYYLNAGSLEVAQEYLLSDPEDRSEYSSVQFYRDNTLNVCRESSYHFVEKVVDEMLLIHRQVDVPLLTYHIGADETVGAWSGSPICQNFLQQQQLSIDQLSDYFVKRIAALLANKGIQVAGWSDGLGHIAANEMPKNAQVNAWKPLFWDGHKIAHSMVNKNWRVIVSIPDATYFDFPYEADPKEPGYYWGSRFTNVRQIFELMPENLPVHAEIWNDRQNHPMTLDDRPVQNNDPQKAYQPMEEGKSTFGLQGHLWSEMIRSDQQAEYMIFPRLLALAERAWYRAKWEPEYEHIGKIYSTDTKFLTDAMREAREQDWQSFISALSLKELPKLDIAGIRYRIPTIGAMVSDHRLFINSNLPGLLKEYQIDNSAWLLYPEVSDTAVSAGIAVKSGQSVHVRARSLNGKRVGRVLKVDN